MVSRGRATAAPTCAAVGPVGLGRRQGRSGWLRLAIHLAPAQRVLPCGALFLLELNCPLWSRCRGRSECLLIDGGTQLARQHASRAANVPPTQKYKMKKPAAAAASGDVITTRLPPPPPSSPSSSCDTARKQVRASESRAGGPWGGVRKEWRSSVEVGGRERWG